MNEDTLKQALKQAVSMAQPVSQVNASAEAYVKFNERNTQKVQRTDNVYKKRG